ncbi:coil containing protein [Vibrio phage 1.250.O._10N.261.55.E11]|nr:coil containing protein [Vibrio phage 1.250.O._10N.261.55.E11]
MRFDGKTTKRKITKWGLGELSSVRSGAQAPAKATILKISADNMRELLQESLRTKYPRPENVQSGLWVCDHDHTHVIYNSYDDRQYALRYSYSDGEVLLGDSPLPVSRRNYYTAEEGNSFFKSATDAFTSSALLAAGFTLDETLVVKSAIDVTGDISKQVETLAVQFGKNTSQDAADDGNIKPIVKLNGDTDMSDTQTPEQIQKNLDAANARVADLEVLAKMSDAEKTYMGKMSDEDKKKFMEMDAEGRKKAMGVAKAADESFTDTMGQTIVKSEVGDAAYGFMKSQNETIAKMQEDTAQREALELVKSLCPNLPGEAGAMAGAIRKCKASLSAGEFSVLEKALKAGDTAMHARTVAKAHDKPVGAGDAQKAFNDGIAKIQSDKNITKSAAMQSSEGLELAKTLRDAQAEENE